MVTTGVAIVAGEITTKAVVDYAAEVVRDVIREVGYTDDEMGISADTCAVMVAIDKQSPDIALGVNEDATQGQGDRRRRPGPDVRLCLQRHARADAAADRAGAPHSQPADRGPPEGRSRLAAARQQEPGHGRIRRAPSRCGSTRSSSRRSTRPDVSNAEIRDFVIDKIIKPVLPEDLVSGEIKYHINPTGRFVVGGPHGDCGLTGRKIIVDTYGGWGRHGGGAFSGKDPTKVDRSAAYMARHVAKNIVAAGLADRCEVQLAYAIGVSEPVSVHVDTEGTGQIEDERICELVRELFPLTPGGIIKYLDLRRPIYRKTAAGGHFGRNDKDFTWESTHRAKELKKAAGSAVASRA